MRALMPVGRSGYAIAAGYLGLISILVIPAPFALVFRILGVREIRKSKDQPHPKHGMGRAIFGILMGTLGTIASLFMIIGMFALPS